MHGICANAVYLGWAAALSGDRARAAEHIDRGLERRAGAILQWTRYGTVTAAEYHDFLTTAWAQAQRLIKGQLNAPESDPPAAP